jgi:acyl-CoA thioester hydrolase
MAGTDQLLASFVWPVRVYYEDTDAAGVVYHANYLKFMERARSEWLLQLGFAHTRLKTDFGVIFVVRKMQIAFKEPARFEQDLLVITELCRMGASLLGMNQRIFLQAQTPCLLCEASVEVVCIQADTMQPVRLPQLVREAFTL